MDAKRRNNESKLSFCPIGQCEEDVWCCRAGAWTLMEPRVCKGAKMAVQPRQMESRDRGVISDEGSLRWDNYLISAMND